MILSIVIPMYKVESFIEKCLNSCLTQDISKEEYEIVCVNDGSPDKSAELARKIAVNNSNIRVIDRQNGGLSAARNTGIENAKGKYIFFVDSDDWIADNCLSKIASVLKAEEPDVLCICAANVFGDRIQRRMNYEGFKTTTGPESMRSGQSSCAPFQIVRREHLNKYAIRFYEGIYHEDVEYTPRMRYFAKKVCYLNDIIYYVYQNPNSITRTVNVKKVYDVVDVVAPHIHQFSERCVDKKHRSVYSEIVASAINTVLTRNTPLSKADKQNVNKRLYEQQYLYEDFANAKLLRYKLEGFLFKLFPAHAVDVFEWMNIRTKLKGK